MGLDVSFYKITKEEVGYFRKTNFFITYFGIHEDRNGWDVGVSKEFFADFVADLKCELVQYKDRKSKEPDREELAPINPRLANANVPFGGSTRYDDGYWEELKHAYDWGVTLLACFDWEHCFLKINCWW